MPNAKKTSRGGSKRGKFKPGKNRKGQGKRMRNFSRLKRQKQD